MQSAMDTYQDYLDEEQASIKAGLRMWTDAGSFVGGVYKPLTLEDATAQELIKIKALRIREKSKKEALQAFKEAAAQGIADAGGQAEKRGITVSTKALIERNRSQWETVKSDIKKATTNGLKEAAHARHGYWYEEAAKQWADRRAKRTTKKMTSLPGQFFKISV